jgi:hypothetical protein
MKIFSSASDGDSLPRHFYLEFQFRSSPFILSAGFSFLKDELRNLDRRGNCRDGRYWYSSTRPQRDSENLLQAVKES